MLFHRVRSDASLLCLSPLLKQKKKSVAFEMKSSGAVASVRRLNMGENFVMFSFDKLCAFIDSAAPGEMRDCISWPWLSDIIMMHSY